MKTTALSALITVGALLLAAPGGHAQAPAAPAGATASAILHADQPGPVVNKNIYGHFAEHLGRGIYEGIWVGPGSPIPNTRGIRNDVVAALKELKIPVLRWPGGCFADEYHWKDGIGPREKRPSMINTHWGGVVEDNSFGTHEFMDLVEQLGTDAYITGNVGSGTPQEMMEWVEYMTSDAISPMANLRRQNGRGLIHDQHLGAAIKRLEDLNPLLLADRELPDLGPRIHIQAILLRQISDHSVVLRKIDDECWAVQSE